ncbi:cleavage and polyadenylation specificity factor subunit 6 isoform X2 [Culicoides brevitarsis]|uniref:cleavage and polyadenylation specificity factor subunit 6 isoform X2 n=1 Tax=Culicoides brevitarsis TaxID=469753 RepID=UPI00307C656D
MAESGAGVDAIDIYGDDLNEDFNQNDDFGGDGADLYDDVLAAPTSTGNGNGPAISQQGDNSQASVAPIDRLDEVESNGSGYNNNMNHLQRRHQLYVGNLTWWTTDQDITDAVAQIGVSDFQEVKFFENRANGQSKGFCVISLGSEGSMRMVMERLCKKDLHGQNPVVTLPTKQALNNFEAQQKTRPTPPQGPSNGPQGGNQGMPPRMQGPPMQGGPRPMMNPNGPPGNFRPMHPGMQGPPGGNMGGMPPRMQGPPMGHPQNMGPNMGPNQGGMPPRFNNQGNWNGPRPNGPMRGPMGPNGPQQRPPMFQGGPPRGPWPRGPMQGPPGPFQGNMQGPPGNMGGMPPRMGGPGNPMGNPGGPAPHVNPAFFNQNQGPHPVPNPSGGHPGGPQQQNMPPQNHPYNQGPNHRGNWPPVNNSVNKPGGPNSGSFPEQAAVPPAPQLSEVEFEEIMTRNRTVSSSAIARAISDASAGEYSSAIETLVTAISLIKQSKVAHDERCKILISSLQDTLNGIETKSYSRRERSRSRERSHRHQRRERSRDRGYRDRSRERRERGSRERDRYRGSSRGDREVREKTRSKERERGNTGDYRESDRSRNKSPDASGENNYESSRYRSSDRDRERRDERERERRH